jgi:hypothetical protein
VAAQHPDVVARLKALAGQEAARLCGDSSKAPGVRPPGRVTKPAPLYPMASKKGKTMKRELSSISFSHPFKPSTLC